MQHLCLISRRKLTKFLVGLFSLFSLARDKDLNNNWERKQKLDSAFINEISKFLQFKSSICNSKNLFPSSLLSFRHE